jgi:hypothetical protein
VQFCGWQRALAAVFLQMCTFLLGELCRCAPETEIPAFLTAFYVNCRSGRKFLHFRSFREPLNRHNETIVSFPRRDCQTILRAASLPSQSGHFRSSMSNPSLTPSNSRSKKSMALGTFFHYNQLQVTKNVPTHSLAGVEPGRFLFLFEGKDVEDEVRDCARRVYSMPFAKKKRGAAR